MHYSHASLVTPLLYAQLHFRITTLWRPMCMLWSMTRTANMLIHRRLIEKLLKWYPDQYIYSQGHSRTFHRGG